MADRITMPASGEVLLHNGDRLDQATFHSLYKRMPTGFKAELIGGVVFVPSPVSYRHGHPHLRLARWLGTYEDETPGVQGLDNTTTILGDESEPQPDLCLRIEPEYGGQTWNKNHYVCGPSELVIEIANSSVAIDLHAKKKDYERAGVLEYLVVLVKERRVNWFELDQGSYCEIEPDRDGILRSRVFPGLWLDTLGVFASRSPQLMKALREGLASKEHASFVKRLETQRVTLRKQPRGRKPPGTGTVKP